MAETTHASDVLQLLRKVRQIRQFTDQPVPQEIVTELLEVARWTGSSRNVQPWHFIVITDKERLAELSRLREPIRWIVGAPLAIAIVLEGENPVSEAYDEGRVTERLMIAAQASGLGSGVAWLGDADQQAQAKRLLGVPQERTARSVVAIGYPAPEAEPRRAGGGGRKPLSELVSYERYGQA